MIYSFSLPTSSVFEAYSICKLSFSKRHASLLKQCKCVSRYGRCVPGATVSKLESYQRVPEHIESFHVWKKVSCVEDPFTKDLRTWRITMEWAEVAHSPSSCIIKEHISLPYVHS